MLSLGILSTGTFFLLAALPYIMEQREAPSPPISEIPIHAIEQASSTISLKQPIPLNEQVLWTYGLNPSSSSQFTSFHFKPINFDSIPRCFDTIHNTTKVKACEYEISRNYLLPESTIPTQKNNCKLDICTTIITLSSRHYSGIELGDITLPLKSLLEHVTHIPTSPREYKIRYRSRSQVQFSWKPILLLIKVHRYFQSQIPNITYQYIFDISIESTIDAIFFPLNAPKSTTRIEYIN
ncbi:hypothetical protein DSO57_1001826 [Entomophthora muscae]|uniref:Uncharacterized protein n=1 Tax=Entomophthora muscae TaxID=34485 RepID=A0ACC2U7F0_9FUNG|nr:hypothetical protein DSO57_1001826 [Entomophthora muscae]